MQIGPKADSRSKKRQKITTRNFVPMSEINVTPFVDIMLVLLIIFMVAATATAGFVIPMRIRNLPRHSHDHTRTRRLCVACVSLRGVRHKLARYVARETRRPWREPQIDKRRRGGG